MTIAPAPARAATFDLVDEPWLPCTFDPGGLREVGLRECLARAHEVRDLVDPSPLATAALHRLLLAVLHRVHGPRDGATWADLWRRGRFDPAPLDAYLEGWRERFDLFHPSRPFYQTAALGEEYAASVSRLVLEMTSGNNATLFDHTMDRGGTTLAAPAAARALVAYQAYAPAGLVSFERGRSQDRSADGPPAAKGALTVLKGATLFETLLLNLVQYDCSAEIPFRCEDDRPAWEAQEDVAPADRLPRGYLDYLTWQSRRVRLFAEMEGDAPVVRRVVIMKGFQLPDGVHRQAFETMIAFARRRDARPNEDPYPSIGFSESRAYWRDSLALVQSRGVEGARPRSLESVASLALAQQVLPWDRLIPLDLLGLVSDRAKPLFWRHERLPIPLRYLDDGPEGRALRDQLAVALQAAEEAGRAVNASVRLLIQLALAPEQDAGGRSPDKEQVRAMVDHLGADRAYWSSLEAPFKRLLQELSENRSLDEEGLPVFGADRLPEWKRRVRRQAHAAFGVAVNGFGGSGRSLKGAVRAERLLNGLLVRALGPVERHEEVRRAVPTV